MRVAQLLERPRALLARTRAGWAEREPRRVVRGILWLVIAVAAAGWVWALWTESISRR